MVEADGLLWVSCTDVDVVQAIDPETNEIVATVETPIASDGLAFDGTTLSVATESGPELAGMDPVSQEIVSAVGRRRRRPDQRVPGDGVRGGVAVAADLRAGHGAPRRAARLIGPALDSR
jgi:hypothetical protein